LLGIVATTLIGIPMGVTQIPPSLFDLSAIAGINQVAFAFFGDPGFASLFADSARIPLVLITIFAFSLADTFDTIGTFIGTGRKTNIFDEADEKALESGSGFHSRMDKALFADATATSIGALLGTSNTTTYIESAAGIEAGGRTGLTSLTTAAMFLLTLPFASLIGIVPQSATAPALIIVGVLMAEALLGVAWNDIEESIPAFLTMTVMTFAYNISYGIAAGFITNCLIKLFRGKGREVHPIIYGASVLFLLNFILIAFKNL
jgi:AGZA family xanthine/uracil permease-like MFS transporter